jgi:hypothetical protein
VGPGDVIRNAELVIGEGAELLVDGHMQQCAIAMQDDATLVIGETGLLEGCRVSGGRLQIRGRFIAPGRLGLRSVSELRVAHTGMVATQLEQRGKPTRFGFDSGCRLRLYIKTSKTRARENDHAD